MKKLILIIGLLLFPSILSALTVSDRVNARIEAEIGTDTQQRAKIAEGIENDTTLREKMAVIVNEEVAAEVNAFAEKIKPIEIDVIQLVKLDLKTIQVMVASMSPVELEGLTIRIYDFGYQARQLGITINQTVESQKLKEIARLIPSRQYPVVDFPFIETTNDDTGIYWVDASRWTNLVKMKEEIKDRKIKLVVLGVGNQVESSYNNFDLAGSGIRTSDFPMFGKEFEIVYQAFKEVRPDVPVGFIAVMHPSLSDWLDSFMITPDFWCLYNCGAYQSNWLKVKQRWFKNRPVVVNLNFRATPVQNMGSDEYKNCVQSLRSLGYKGLINWRTK